MPWTAIYQIIRHNLQRGRRIILALILGSTLIFFIATYFWGQTFPAIPLIGGIIWLTILIGGGLYLIIYLRATPYILIGTLNGTESRGQEAIEQAKMAGHYLHLDIEKAFDLTPTGRGPDRPQNLGPQTYLTNPNIYNKVAPLLTPSSVTLVALGPNEIIAILTPTNHLIMANATHQLPPP
ncbi:MAG TPA: hypothetical protein VLL52_22225 [Anaerolineae bacterium]|nr:hypothetical protein [Anaerolineae bacterium]